MHPVYPYPARIIAITFTEYLGRAAQAQALNLDYFMQSLRKLYATGTTYLA